jgi:hypothetical protein
LRSGDIGFAESYIANRWDTPDLARLLAVVAVNHAALESAIYGRWWGSLAYRVRHLLRGNSRAQAKRNVHAHYDLGNAFYALWLDGTMTYSSGMFEGRMELALEEAQAIKYERILENLEAIYRESFDRAKTEGSEPRMIELESAFMRDQLMFEILLDMRDLFTVAPAAGQQGTTALETLERLRRLAKR